MMVNISAEGRAEQEPWSEEERMGIFMVVGKDDVKLVGVGQVIFMTLGVGQFHFHQHILKLQQSERQPGLSANLMHHNATTWEWQYRLDCHFMFPTDPFLTCLLSSGNDRIGCINVSSEGGKKTLGLDVIRANSDQNFNMHL